MLNQINDLAVVASRWVTDQGITHGSQVLALCQLLVDPGEKTLDWLLVETGEANLSASGMSATSGRNTILSQIIKALESKISRHIPMDRTAISRVGDALQNGRPLKVAGTYHDLAEFDPILSAAVGAAAAPLVEGARPIQDKLDLIAIVGCHPDMLAKELRRSLSGIPVFVMPGSTMLTNARGLQSIAEIVARQQAQSRAPAKRILLQMEICDDIDPDLYQEIIRFSYGKNRAKRLRELATLGLALP